VILIQILPLWKDSGANSRAFLLSKIACNIFIKQIALFNQTQDSFLLISWNGESDPFPGVSNWEIHFPFSFLKADWTISPHNSVPQCLVGRYLCRRWRLGRSSSRFDLFFVYPEFYSHFFQKCNICHDCVVCLTGGRPCLLKTLIHTFARHAVLGAY